MASPHQIEQEKKIGFKTFILFKDQTLGIGSYGAVCKAKCDDLLCAAKIIHPTLFDPTALHQIASHRERDMRRLPIRRFQRECEFLSTVQHPNIVQYLGTHQDPNTGLPVLLMELMDDSLTHFLESSTQPIPYHIQVNICHDITLALSFLHSNNILHRDLSSNNVLMHGNVLAKVTDFGMARLDDINPQATHFTNTMCPGSDVYMPPEAVQDKPVYTEKIDCFSFGVIIVQTLTREFPKPGDRMMTVHDPRYPRPLKMSVPELERRQNHINRVDPNHPLLPIALSCLKDNDSERPSAQLLCERVAALKETAKYKNASERVNDSDSKDGEYERFRQALEEKNYIIGEKDAMIAEKEQQLRQCREEIQQQNQQIQQQAQQINQLERDKRQLEGERNQAIQEKERQLGRVNQQLEESEQLIADFGKRNTELEEELSVLRIRIQEKGGGAKARSVDRANIKLRWREGKKAPCEMGKFCDAVVHNSIVYCKYNMSNNLYTYHIPSSSWSWIWINHPLKSGFAITVIDGLLTTVGGRQLKCDNSNKLFSLTGKGSRWIEEFPPMPTERCCVSALCTGTALIVAGGSGIFSRRLKTVEVLNTETRQWHTAPDLLEPMSQSSLTLCGDHVYLLGGYTKDKARACSVYSCLLSSFLSSAGSKSLGGTWNRVADLPVEHSTAVTLHGQLLAIGGRYSKDKLSTAAVHIYQPTIDSWEVISHMPVTIPRNGCLAAVLPDNQLMVVGGWTTKDNKCDSVEFGTLI